MTDAFGPLSDLTHHLSRRSVHLVRRATLTRGDYETTWPVLVVDPGSTVDALVTWLPLVVADGTEVPRELDESERVRARLTGDVDDTAASACLRPSAGWPELTDEDAVRACRSTFVVTRIGPLD